MVSPVSFECLGRAATRYRCAGGAIGYRGLRTRPLRQYKVLRIRYLRPTPSIALNCPLNDETAPGASSRPDTDVLESVCWSGLTTVYRREVLAKRLSTNSELPLFPRRSLAGRRLAVNPCRST